MLFRGPLLWLLLLAALASLGLQRSEAAVGGQSIWTNRYNGPGNNTDIAAAVAVDSSGKVFVTGHSDGGAGWSMDYATVAYSSTGVPLASRTVTRTLPLPRMRGFTFTSCPAVTLT